MNIKSKTNLIIMIIIAVVLAAVLAFAGGCRSEAGPISQESTEQETDIEKTEEAGSEEETTKEDIQSSGQEEVEGSEAEETVEVIEAEVVEEEVKIPQEITAEIEEADGCYNDGLYAEAVKEYRDVLRAVEGSELPEDMKEELLAGIDENYQKALNITEIARNHHSNAMTLDYENRKEEAIAELKAALAIYPKYQAAIDALDSLEALMGLK
jgi:tetratricopeptide (TPR) repeat protein